MWTKHFEPGDAIGMDEKLWLPQNAQKQKVWGFDSYIRACSGYTCTVLWGNRNLLQGENWIVCLLSQQGDGSSMFESFFQQRSVRACHVVCIVDVCLVKQRKLPALMMFCCLFCGVVVYILVLGGRSTILNTLIQVQYGSSFWWVLQWWHLYCRHRN